MHWAGSMESPDLGAVRRRLEGPQLLRPGPEAVLYVVFKKRGRL